MSPNFDQRQKRKKILIADESITIQKLVHLTFADRAVDVITASDGPDALTKVNRMLPDLVIVDSLLRQTNGIQLCQSIRSTPSLSKIKVILLQTKTAQVDAEEDAAAKPDGILKKPFDAKSLSSLVDEIFMDDEPTLKKVSGPFSAHSKAQKKLEDAVHEVEFDSEGETVTKKVSDTEFLERPFLSEEVSKTVKTENFRPAKDETKHEETPISGAEATLRESEMPQLEAEAIERWARDEVRLWIEKNLSSMAEKILKEEIQRLTQTRT